MAIVHSWSVVSTSGDSSVTDSSLTGKTTATVGFTTSVGGASYVLRDTVTDTSTGFVTHDDVAVNTVAASVPVTSTEWVRGLATDTLPSGTATVEIDMTIKGCAGAGEQHYGDRFGWFNGFVPLGQWSPGGIGAVNQLVTLLRRLIPPGQESNTSIPFTAVRNAELRNPDASGAVGEYDNEVPSRMVVEYKARSSLPGTGGIPISVTVDSNPVRVTLPPHPEGRWFLSDLDNPDAIVPIMVKEWRYDRTIAASVIDLPGDKYPVVHRTGPNARGSMRPQMSLWVVDRDNRVELDALLDAASMLFLRDPSGAVATVVQQVDNETWERLRAVDTRDPKYIGDAHEASFGLVEVEDPALV